MSFHSLFENSSITLFFPLRLLLTESRKGYLFMSCFTLYSVFKVRLPDKIRISAVFDCSNLYSIPFSQTAQAACSTVFLLMSKLRFDESLSFLLDPFRFTKMVGSSGLEPPFFCLCQSSALTKAFLSCLTLFVSQKWWAQVDSNHRPHAYQACALTT